MPTEQRNELMEAEETDKKPVFRMYIKPTFEGASEMTDATSDEVIGTIIGVETQEVEVEIGEEFEIPLKWEAEFDEALRVYSKEDNDLYDPSDPPTSLSAGRYVFEGDAIRALEHYSDDGDEF
jgi:hypothetical protein